MMTMNGSNGGAIAQIEVARLCYHAVVVLGNFNFL